jgi:hypothetical protein
MGMMTAMGEEDGQLSSLLVVWDESAIKVSSHLLTANHLIPAAMRRREMWR